MKSVMISKSAADNCNLVHHHHLVVGEDFTIARLDGCLRLLMEHSCTISTTYLDS